MIDKMNKGYEPTRDELIGIVEGNGNALLKGICEFIENDYNAKLQIDYSVCSGAPGWNFKYKKGGKSLCTVYPEKDKFIILATLNFDVSELFNIVAENFSSYVRDLVSSVKPFNGSKWLMIEVTDEQIAEDVKNLIKLKIKK